MQLIDGRPARHGLRIAGVVSLAVALVLAGPARDDAGASVPAAKRISDGTIAVAAVSTAAEADQVTRGFHAQGIDVSIDTVPSGPQLVGTWVYSSFSAAVPKALISSVVDQTHGYTATVALPSSFRGAIRLAVGRAPAKGEQIQVDGVRNALAPGGLLGCLHATGADPARAEAAAQALGYAVTWTDGDTATPRGVGASSTGERVAAAYIDNATPGQVQFVVATPGTVRYDVRSRLGYSPEQWKTLAKESGVQKGCDS